MLVTAMLLNPCVNSCFRMRTLAFDFSPYFELPLHYMLINLPLTAFISSPMSLSPWSILKLPYSDLQPTTSSNLAHDLTFVYSVYYHLLLCLHIYFITQAILNNKINFMRTSILSITFTVVTLSPKHCLPHSSWMTEEKIR